MNWTVADYSLGCNTLTRKERFIETLMSLEKQRQAATFINRIFDKRLLKIQFYNSWGCGVVVITTYLCLKKQGLLICIGSNPSWGICNPDLQWMLQGHCPTTKNLSSSFSLKMLLIAKGFQTKLLFENRLNKMLRALSLLFKFSLHVNKKAIN